MRNRELHWSALKHMARSPAHYDENLRHPVAMAPQMTFGTLTHTVALGGEKFVVWNDDRGAKGWKAFKEEHEGELIVTADELDRARAVRSALKRHPTAWPLFHGCETEVDWKADMFGRKCGGRIDAIKPGVLIDLKTTTNTHPRELAWQCRRMAYAAQVAWYRQAMRALGRRVDECYIIGVEVKAPFAVTVLRLTERALESGDRLNRLWAEQLAVCEETNRWPSYSEAVVDLDDLEEDVSLVIDGDEVLVDGAAA